MVAENRSKGEEKKVSWKRRLTERERETRVGNKYSGYIFPWCHSVQWGGSLSYGGQMEVSYNEWRRDLMIFSILKSPACELREAGRDTKGEECSSQVWDEPINSGRIQLSVCLVSCLFDLRWGGDEDGGFWVARGEAKAVGVVNLSVGHSCCSEVKLC